ncbi:metallothionein-I gene transcription activator [Elsinoe ampelina]|uniref:DNA-directed RNA polymerases I, II, and III subunit RPABC4 n=2 Tax=Elsinoe TaxID=40996 RepID=A0A8K0KXD2_9PEZI|nr:metallothionein-I gene transcription activator [Elsinoe ampelina]KAG8625871.1 hypothetical protein KVT40_006272 [Elsinoe batatas]
MSREAFQAPTIPSGGNGGSNAFAPQAGADAMDIAKPVAYLCGDCDTKVYLKKGDPIRCKECGYRVLYKQRTERLIQFEAR